MVSDQALAASVLTPTFKRIRLWQVLAMTWLAYAAFVFGRKPFSVARMPIEKDVHLSQMMSSWVDSAFLTTYTLGQFVYGNAKARFSSKKLLLFGVFGSAACNFVFGGSSNPYAFVFLWGMNGLFQSFGWPTCLSLITPWIAASERGSIMGLWGSCMAVGGILGNWVTSYVMMSSLGWRGAFFAVSCIIGAIGVLIVFVMVAHPNSLGLLSPHQAANGHNVEDIKGCRANLDGEAHLDEQEALKVSATAPPSSDTNNAMTAAQAIMVPGVLGMCISYSCQKIVRYALLFWLPYYYTKELGYGAGVAGFVASAFDLGGVLGSIGAGYFSDHFGGGKRRVLSCVLLNGGGMLSLLGFIVAKEALASSYLFCSFVAFACGFFLFGCDSLMTGATIQDVADRQGIPQHTSVIVGVVGGIGSGASILQGPLTGIVTGGEGGNWDTLFLMLFGLSMLAVLSMYTPVKLEQQPPRRTNPEDK